MPDKHLLNGWVRSHRHRRVERPGSAIYSVTSHLFGGEAAARLAEQLAMPPRPELPRAERNLIAHLLDEVPPLSAAIAPPLKDFAVNLCRDIAAIQAALDLPWATSPVKGQINRLNRNLHLRRG